MLNVERNLLPCIMKTFMKEDKSKITPVFVSKTSVVQTTTNRNNGLLK